MPLTRRLRRDGVGVADDLLESGGVATEGTAASRAELEVGAPAAAGAGLADGHVAGLLQRGDLLGQRRVAELQAVADEGEVGPFGRGQQGNDRQAGRRVDEFVELRSGAHQPTAWRRRAVIRWATGRPAAYTAAVTTPASVLGSGAPAAPSATRAST